jgi:uncharacterized iron-regulated protein
MKSGGSVVALIQVLPVLLCFALGSQLQAMSERSPLIVDVVLGEPVTMDTMVDDLAAVKIVYIGEVHTIKEHHALEARILDHLADRKIKLALGMEMFAGRQQEILDRWQEGNESLEHLIRDLGADHWTNLTDYGPLLLSARERRIPILGLNADDSLVRKVAWKGLDGLSASEKRLVPAGVTPVDPLSDRLLRLRLKVHRAFQATGLHNVVLAQALRDQTMATTVARFLRSAQGKDRLILVVAGTGHMSYGLGIPSRVERIKKTPHRIVVLSESGHLVLTEAEKRESVPIEITHADLEFLRRPIGDYLYILPSKTKSEPAEPHAYQADRT